MVAVVRMTMLCFLAPGIVHIMCCNNKDYTGYQEPQLQMMPGLFCAKEQDAGTEHDNWQQAMVMLSESVRKRITTNQKRYQDHAIFK
jgi:hypothetical protein